MSAVDPPGRAERHHERQPEQVADGEDSEAEVHASLWLTNGFLPASEVRGAPRCLIGPLCHVVMSTFYWLFAGRGRHLPPITGECKGSPVERGQAFGFVNGFAQVLDDFLCPLCNNFN